MCHQLSQRFTAFGCSPERLALGYPRRMGFPRERWGDSTEPESRSSSFRDSPRIRQDLFHNRSEIPAYPGSCWVRTQHAKHASASSYRNIGIARGRDQQQMLPESVVTTSESFVRKNFSTDFSSFFLKHRPCTVGCHSENLQGTVLVERCRGSAEPVQVIAADYIVIPMCLVGCGRWDVEAQWVIKIFRYFIFAGN